MKNPKIILTLMLALVGALSAFSATPPLPPVEIVVVVSGYASPEVARNEQKIIFALLLKDAPPGTRVAMWDGYSLNCIFSADVPVLRYDSAEARAERLVHALISLKRWSEQPTTMLTDASLRGSNAVRLPELVAELPPADPARPRRILVLGSPFYLSTTEPTFCMLDGRFPSDAHLTAPTTETVFGVADREQALDGTVIYWAYGQETESQWTNGAHKLAVQRWWVLWTAGQKGVLAAFSSNTKVIEERLLANDTKTSWHFSRDSGDAKIRMLTANPRQAPAWLTLPTPIAQAPAPEASVVPQPVVPQTKMEAAVVPLPVAPKDLLPESPLIVAPILPPSAPIHIAVPVRLDHTKSGIGIAWPSGDDLDIYVQSAPGGKEVYYRNDRSPDAFLYSDERYANFGGRYEFVEFRKPVDLKRTTIWVNYYGGHTVKPTGQIVLFDHGRIKVGAFTIPAVHGNGGRNGRERNRSPYWVRIDLGSLVDAEAPLAAYRPGNR